MVFPCSYPLQEACLRSQRHRVPWGFFPRGRAWHLLAQGLTLFVVWSPDSLPCFCCTFIPSCPLFQDLTTFPGCGSWVGEVSLPRAPVHEFCLHR